MVGEVLPPAVDSVSIAVMNRLLFACLALPLSVFAQGGLPNQPYIYVEGTAETEKPADMVTLGFDLVGRNADLVKANQEASSESGKNSRVTERQEGCRERRDRDRCEIDGAL